IVSLASMAAGCGEPDGTAPPPVTGLAAPTCAPLGVRDPDFASSDVWTSERGATIAPGAASIDTSTMCAHGGIRQPVATAPLSCMRSLVMNLDLTLDGDQGLSFAAGLNGGWTSPSVRFGQQTLAVCLGARAFEGQADLFLGMGSVAWLCPVQSDDGPK